MRAGQLAAPISGPRGLAEAWERLQWPGEGGRGRQQGQFSCDNCQLPGVALASSRVRTPHERRAPPSGIVISSSAASPSEGTSSDSCLTFSVGDGPAGLGGRLAAHGLVGTCSPLKLASPLLGTQSATPVLQAQGALGGIALLPVSFQEGRRASDTSLTQGDSPLRSPFRLPWEMPCAALAGVTLSWVAEVPSFSSQAWVEQQPSPGRSKVPPGFQVAWCPGVLASWDRVTGPLVSGLKHSRDTWMPGSSS